MIAFIFWNWLFTAAVFGAIILIGEALGPLDIPPKPRPPPPAPGADPPKP